MCTGVAMARLLSSLCLQKEAENTSDCMPEKGNPCDLQAPSEAGANPAGTAA